MSSYWYCAYGLRIESEVRLLVPPSEPAAAADVVVRIAAQPASEPSRTDKPASSLLHATSNEIRCAWEKAGIFTIRDGREILVELYPGVTHDIIAPWIQGAALSLILHQRGMLVLHASAAAIAGRAIAFVGQVGWGKSTTAAAMSTRGHQLLADDIVAVRIDETGQPLLVPGFPHLKLMSGAVDFLGEDPENLVEVTDDPTKRLRISRQAVPDQPLPLAAVYVLSESPDLSIDPLRPLEALPQMMEHVFVARMTEFLRKTGTEVSHFTNLTQLIKHAAVCRLRRPKSFDLLPRVAEMVEQHAMACPVATKPTSATSRAREACHVSQH